MQARFVQFHQVFAERHGWIYCSPSHWNFSVYWEGSEKGRRGQQLRLKLELGLRRRLKLDKCLFLRAFLGTSTRVAGIFKQNFQLKFENRNIKLIVW